MSNSRQPNVPGLGTLAGYGLRFWVLVVAIGAAAGLGGAALIELLRAIQHLSFGYHSGSLLGAVRRSTAERHIAVLALAGVIVGVVLVARRGERVAGVEISEALWQRDGRLKLWSSLLRAVESIVVVGMGVSLGREAGPQLTGAAVASELCDHAHVTPSQRRLLVACGAGAGMAAVYNVPLGGALFALEVLLGTITLPLVLPALATTLTATAVAWILLPTHPIYAIPSYGISASQIVWAAIIGPLAGFAAVLWVRVIARVHRLRLSGALRVVAPIALLAGLGALSIAYPQLLGNGQDTVQLAFNARIGLGLLAVLLVLKPLVTAASLGSGAPGGLFTPTLAYGALFGGLLGHLWSELWPGAPGGSYAIIGGGAVLAAAMQGPLSAVVLILELTRHADTLMVPILLAVTEATVVARLMRAPSIYAARLNHEPSRAAA